MAFDNHNTIPKAKSFSKAKEAFLNALEIAKGCSRRFKKKRSEQPDEKDKALLDFIETFVSGFPKGAEEIPRTRERIMSRRGWKDIIISGRTLPSSVDIRATPVALAESPHLFPASFVNAAASAPFPPSSSLTPTPFTLISRAPAGARPLIPNAIEVILETSTMGQGQPTDDEARPQAAPITSKAAPVHTSLPGVIIQPSAIGLGTQTIWPDNSDPASGQAVSAAKSQETSGTPTPIIELNNLCKAIVPASKRRVIIRDPSSLSLSPSSNGSSTSSGLTRSEKSRARYRSPTPYPVASRPAPPPPVKSQKSKKRSRDTDDDKEENNRPTTRTRSSQESLASSSPSVTRSNTPPSTEGIPSPPVRRSQRLGRSSKKGKGKDTPKDD